MVGLTIKQFRERIDYKYSYEYIRQLIRSKVISAYINDNGQYMIDAKEIDKIIKRDVTVGRKANKLSS